MRKTNDLRQLMRIEKKVKRKVQTELEEQRRQREVYDYADALFNNVDDIISQIGCIINLKDGRSRKCLLY